MIARCCVYAGLVFLALGCASQPNPPAPERLPKTLPSNSTLRQDDPELDAAISKARASLPDFLKRLAHPQSREVFSVEAAFTAPDGSHEHLWIGDVAYKDGDFTGTLTSKPSKVVGLKFGGIVTAKSADVTDWMILRSGRSEGGFTVDVLMRREAQPR